MSRVAKKYLRHRIMAVLDLANQVSYNVANKTRQGYARKRILKPAGYFFVGPGL